MANQALLALVYSSDWAGIVDPDGLNIRPRYVYWSHISSGEPFMKSFKFEKCFDPRPLMLKIITLVFRGASLSRPGAVTHSLILIF